MRIAARYADEFNLSSSSPERAREKFDALSGACEAIGRDPASITRSVMAGVLVGRDDDEVKRRQHELLAAFGNVDAGEDWFQERAERWVYGTPDEARAQVKRFEDAGAERMMLQNFIARDLEMVDLLGDVLL
jgi:alkanesulfonate monooxygenase SsuD/methylene tetrahydromethanopterin reductase-like flavin-dependent oxidoreductase (luciferase family)